MAKKLRTRKHKVVLNRSYGGDIGIGFFLLLMGLFLFLPMYYTVIQSLKPLDELFMFPPKFYVKSPTFDNFRDLVTLMGETSLAYFLNMVLRILPSDVLKSALSGLANGLANFLTLVLAGLENASVLFPIISAGTILAALICGRVVFKEKLKANHYAALVSGIIAVVLMKL